MVADFTQVNLKPLRDDLELHKGPAAPDGSPTYTVFDPVANKFYRLGWIEFEILSRWHLRNPVQILKSVLMETTLLDLDIERISTLASFLNRNHLLEGYDEGTEKNFLETQEKSKVGWTKKILRQYMFFRVPLFNPQDFLEFISPVTRHFFTKTWFYTVLTLGLLSLFLLLREWDAFTHSFLHFFNFKGLVLYFFVIMFAKAVHEMGHAITAHHYGCRVPVIGAGLLVFFPVLYTDTSDAWKLQSRKARLMISAAGVMSELVLAVFAALAWVVLPEGGLKSAAFMLASTTWVMTLFINLNPFMRYDGYYLLSDYLDLPAVQQKALEVMRWHLRRFFMKTEEEAPPYDHFTFLTCFGFAIPFYRLGVFSAISLVLYHMMFKALALILISVNFYASILKPVFRFMATLGDGINKGTHTPYFMRLSMVVFVAALVFLVPWQNRVNLPAVLYPTVENVIYAEYPGVVMSVNVHDGQRVKKGDVLIQISSPDLENDFLQQQERLKDLQWRYDVRHMDDDLSKQSLVLASEIENAKAAVEGSLKDIAALTIIAPNDGTVHFFEQALQAGMWVGKHERLVSVYDFSKVEIRGYASENDVSIMQQDFKKARFYPHDTPMSKIDVPELSVEGVSVNRITDPLFVSLFKGPIAVHEDKNKNFIPEISNFPVRSNVMDAESLPVHVNHVERGILVVEGHAQSIFHRVMTKIWSIFIRESGF